MKTKGPRALKNQASSFYSLVKAAPCGISRTTLELLGFQDNIEYAVKAGGMEIVDSEDGPELVRIRSPHEDRENLEELRRQVIYWIRHCGQGALLATAREMATLHFNHRTLRLALAAAVGEAERVAQ